MCKDTLYGRSGSIIQTMAGIDIALWDLKGKFLSQPIYKLLGAFKTKMRVYSSNMFRLQLKIQSIE